MAKEAPILVYMHNVREQNAYYPVDGFAIYDKDAWEEHLALIKKNIFDSSSIDSFDKTLRTRDDEIELAYVCDYQEYKSIYKTIKLKNYLV